VITEVKGSCFTSYQGIKEFEKRGSQEFTGVDGEGTAGKCRECRCERFTESADLDMCECGHRMIARHNQPATGHEHKYVLLGCGQNQIENPDGLGWEEIFTFLYDQFRANRLATYVGFYLGYDFTQWFNTLPKSKAFQLLTTEGADKRKSQRAQHSKGKNPVPYPVKVAGMHGAWEVDIHADRRVKIRPKICACPGDTHLSKEKRGGKPCPAEHWMYICDTGGFFQTSFLNVINPDKWKGNPPCTPDEYEDVRQGKERRSNAELDDDMRRYNRLENKLLGRVMASYRDGLKEAAVTLNKGQWYGPGQAAQAWLRNVGAPTRAEIEKVVKPAVLDAARQSYYGGWFEIMAHGIIPGITWEYDINSAYPYIISRLPCLLHGTWETRKPRTPADTLPALPDCPGGHPGLRLVHAAVYGSDRHIGTMLYRDTDQSILRPLANRGWFWQHELDAASRAGLIDRIQYYTWHTYMPCNCKPPLRGMSGLYDDRIKVGKDSAKGKAFKLVYNSAYGKMAQSVGEPVYANPVYASLITAGCRAMILDAIATHPGGSKAVVMVATDGVFFTSKHPGLPVSKRLGEWDCSERDNLTLFKPGVYWDDQARNDIADGKAPQFKARGVSAAKFSKSIAKLDEKFRTWDGVYPQQDKDWPTAKFHLGFSVISAKQALRRHDWTLAGHVSDVEVTHSSQPNGKRATGYYDTESGIYRSSPHDLGMNPDDLPWLSKPYEKTFGSAVLAESGVTDPEQYGIAPDGLVRDIWYQGMGIKGD